MKPSSLILIRRGVSVCPLCKIPLTYASEAESTTCISILNSMCVGPISGGAIFGAFLELDGIELRWYCPPVQLCDRGPEMYDASLSMCSTISLALNWTTAVGLVSA